MLRQIGELSKGYRSSTYGKAAQQEYGASLPARGDDFEQPPLVVGGNVILSLFYQFSQALTHPLLGF